MITAICVLSPCLGILKCSGSYIQKECIWYTGAWLQSLEPNSGPAPSSESPSCFLTCFFSFSKVGNEPGNVHE